MKQTEFQNIVLQKLQKLDTLEILIQDIQQDVKYLYMRTDEIYDICRQNHTYLSQAFERISDNQIQIKQLQKAL